MQAKKTPAPAASGNGGDEHCQVFQRHYTAAWRRWAMRVAPHRMTERQALAIAYLQAGIADSPERALDMVEAVQ